MEVMNGGEGWGELVLVAIGIGGGGKAKKLAGRILLLMVLLAKIGEDRRYELVKLAGRMKRNWREGSTDGRKFEVVLLLFLFLSLVSRFAGTSPVVVS